MHREASLAALLLLILATLASAGEFTGRVVGVSDGGTITVLDARREVRVRLYGVDSPEGGQAFGQNAKQHASELVFGKDVLVREKDRDRHGRNVADVVLPDGRSLSVEIIRAGFAWWFRKYALGNRELESLEAEARAAKRGLWSRFVCSQSRMKKGTLDGWKTSGMLNPIWVHRTAWR